MSFISEMFGGGKTPALPTPLPTPAPPTVDDATKLRDEANARTKRHGRAATILTGESGAGSSSTAAKVLLGG